ncbi:MAG: hypothetical protein ACLVJ6_12280 [Merdibacter sp.]
MRWRRNTPEPYGTPHPNEPIGSMMLDAFTRILAEDPALRAALDYTWYIIKSSDVDGMAKNEGWFKGPFTISQYQHNFFRPAFDQQVEWSFPIDYKQYHFMRPRPKHSASCASSMRSGPCSSIRCTTAVSAAATGISRTAKKPCTAGCTMCPPNTASG